MAKNVVVLGAGTGGTMTANLLDKKLGKEARVTVVGETGEHVFQPANLDVAFRGASPDRPVRDERPLLRRAIRLDTTGATRVAPARKIVRLKDGRELAYDALVIATGAIA